MARGLTALRAALGAVGGVTDALQQRELLAEKRRRDEEAAAIQQAQLYSSLGMRAQPYRPASEEQVGVAPASSMDRAALTSALQQGMGVEPPTRDGATTSFQRSVQRGMGVEPTQAGATLSPLQSAFQKATSGDLASSYTKRTAETPGMRQKLPGMEVAWQAGPTDEEKRTARLADLRAEKDVELEYQDKTINTERERMRGVYRGAYPTATEQQVEGMVNGIKPEDMGLEVLTPSQKKAQARQENLDALDRKFKLAQIASYEATTDKKKGEGAVPVLPSVTDAIGYLSSLTPDMVRKISPSGVSIASQGQQAGGALEVAGSLGGGLFGITRDEEKRYAQQVGSIADAVARASEVGVLTNFDINRFRSQVVFSPFDSEQIKMEKVNRAKKWGLWLANNKKAFDEGKLNAITKAPEQYVLQNPWE